MLSNENGKDNHDHDRQEAFRYATILWSTRSGRAKACARRTARLLQTQCDITVVRPTGGASPKTIYPDKTRTKKPTEWMYFGCTIDEFSGGSIEPWLQLAAAAAAPKKMILLLFVSTTGDGEHVEDCMGQTWSKVLMQKSCPSLQGLTFGLFALGDRAYGPQAYCASGRKLATRLVQLGATLFLKTVGYGDDATPGGGVFSDLDHWWEQVLKPGLLSLSLSSRRNGTLQQAAGSCDVKKNKSHEEEEEEEKDDDNDDDDDDDDPWKSPYSVSVMTNSAEIPPDGNTSEANHVAFQEYYDEYFYHLACPRSAYRYLENTTNTTALVPPCRAEVESNDRISCPQHSQETRHLRLVVSTEIPSHHHRPPFGAGDVAVIMPQNSEAAVQTFLQLVPPSVAAMANQVLQIEHHLDHTNGLVSWPRQCTLVGWLTHCADLASRPEREDLRRLAHYCTDAQQAAKLLDLAETAEGAELYADYIVREKRNWLDVWHDFDSCRPTQVADYLALLPPMQPRRFSIANAPPNPPTLKGGQFGVELCVAVVKNNTRLGRTFEGLCSNYLARCSTTQNAKTKAPAPAPAPAVLHLWIEPGSFSRIPWESDIPVWCIGAGTGIAPLRAILQARQQARECPSPRQDSGNSSSLQKDDDKKEEEEEEEEDKGEETTAADNEKEESSNHKEPAANGNHDAPAQHPWECFGNAMTAENILLFGCRHSQADYYYQTEWKSQSFSHFSLWTAFSRCYPAPKTHVQHLLARWPHIWIHHMLHRQGVTYIAGNANMARDVREVLLACLKQAHAKEEDAQKLWKRWIRNGRLAVEAWN